MTLLGWLNRVNAAHPWSHNDFYGPWVARQVMSSGARTVLVKHPRRTRVTPESMTAPTAPARESLAEISAHAADLLPGARIRRRLFWRYSLVYDAPR